MSNPARTNSIRQNVLGHLAAGTPNAVIYAMLKEHFPGTAAAEKPIVHTSWYRGWAKKNGEAFTKAVAGRTAPLLMPTQTCAEPAEYVFEEAPTEYEQVQAAEYERLVAAGHTCVTHDPIGEAYGVTAPCAQCNKEQDEVSDPNN